MVLLHITEEATNHLRDEIDANVAAVERLDGEIELLMCSVRKLQFTKLQHQQKIRHCQGLLTLARRLPPELLARIFEMCARDGYTLTPLAASHVCSEWRQAAKISTTWSHVYVDLDSRDPYGRTLFWLDRAGGSLLYITLEVRGDTARLPAVMNALLQQIPRWRTFTVRSAFLNHVNWLFSLCNRPAVELRLIDLNILHEINHEAIAPASTHNLPGLVNAFPQSHQLKTFRITRSVIPSHDSIPSFASDLSVHLTADPLGRNSSVEEVLRLLESHPNMERFSLSLEYGCDRTFDIPINSRRTVELPNLKTLVLTGSPSMFGLLSFLKTPSLESLHIRSSLNPLGHPDEDVSSFIRIFFERSESPLRKFELHDIDLSVSDFGTCLAAVPSLREMYLHETDITDEILLQFTPSSGICPELTKIDLRWCGQVTGEALVRLAKDKLASTREELDQAQQIVQPLAQLTVINCCSVREQDILDLTEIVDCRIVARIEDYCRALLVPVQDLLSSKQSANDPPCRTIWVLPERKIPQEVPAPPSRTSGSRC